MVENGSKCSYLRRPATHTQGMDAFLAGLQVLPLQCCTTAAVRCRVASWHRGSPATHTCTHGDPCAGASVYKLVSYALGGAQDVKER